MCFSIQRERVVPCVSHFLWLEDFSGGISPLLEVPLSEKRKWRSAGGSMGRERGGGGGFDAGCLLFKARFSPDTSVLFINSFSRAVKNQCALHCKQFIMTGDGGKKSSTARELICLSTITRLCSVVRRRLEHPDKDWLAVWNHKQ